MSYQRVKESEGERSQSSSECESSIDYQRRPHHIYNIVATVLVIALCASNFGTFWYFKHQKHTVEEHTYTGIEKMGHKWQQFHLYSEFSSEDKAVADAAWASYAVNGFVALDHDWAAERKLPKARLMPSTPEKGIYVVDGFHQLHCVMYIREQMAKLLDGQTLENSTVHHTHHCYDSLRQAITCRADDTPLYSPEDIHGTGEGQLRKCRNWAALEDWVVQRTACYSSVQC